jgi:hypothetical protein
MVLANMDDIIMALRTILCLEGVLCGAEKAILPE